MNISPSEFAQITSSLANLCSGQADLITALKIKPNPASKASIKEYEDGFHFGVCKPTEFSSSSDISVPVEVINALILEYTSTILQDYLRGNVLEKAFIQKISKDLIEKLVALYFDTSKVRCVNERRFSSKVGGLVYAGDTDHAIVNAERDVALLCWEDKRSDYKWNFNREMKGAIAQAGLEVTGEISKLLKTYSVVPKELCGILSCGINFCLISCVTLESGQSWRHSPIVSTIHEKRVKELMEGNALTLTVTDEMIDTDGINTVATLLAHAIKAGLSVHQELDGTSVYHGNCTDDIIDEDDRNGGKGGRVSGRDEAGNNSKAARYHVSSTPNGAASSGNKEGEQNRSSNTNTRKKSIMTPFKVLTTAAMDMHNEENGDDNMALWMVKNRYATMLRL